MSSSSTSLDLHGIRHEKARVLVEDFFYMQEPPFEVVTGNSETMRQIVLDLCREFNYICFHKNPNNVGSLTVIEGWTNESFTSVKDAYYT